MMKNIRITCSPFSPGIEVVEDIVIKACLPYSENNVTVQVNPNIQGYDEKLDQSNVKVRQATVTTKTDQTHTFKLDFKDNNVQKVKIGEKEYKIKLMNIGKENIKGQDFPTFEFFVESGK